MNLVDSCVITEAKVSDLKSIVATYKQLLLKENISDYMNLDNKGCEYYFLSFIVQESKKLYLIYKSNENIGFLLVRSHKPQTLNIIEVWDEMLYVQQKHKSSDLENNILTLMDSFAKKLERKQQIKAITYLTGYQNNNIDIKEIK